MRRWLSLLRGCLSTEPAACSVDIQYPPPIFRADINCMRTLNNTSETTQNINAAKLVGSLSNSSFDRYVVRNVYFLGDDLLVWVISLKGVDCWLGLGWGDVEERYA